MRRQMYWPRRHSLKTFGFAGCQNNFANSGDILGHPTFEYHHDSKFGVVEMGGDFIPLNGTNTQQMVNRPSVMSQSIHFDFLDHITFEQGSMHGCPVKDIVPLHPYEFPI